MEQAIIGINFDSKSSQIHWTSPHHKVKINTYNYAIQGAVPFRYLKEANIYTSEYSGKLIDETLNTPENLYNYAKKIADERAKVAEEQAKAGLDELVETTRWTRVDGGDGSLLKTFPKETKKEMLNTLKMVKSSVPHKYKKAYLKNIDNKIAVLEYLLKD